jgi:hypothetical protein
LPNREIESLGELLTKTTIEVCERLSIPYKAQSINVVQLDLDIKQSVPPLAKLMWDYFYAFHRYIFYCSAIEQNREWATQSELALRESELRGKKNIFYEQLEVFTKLAHSAKKSFPIHELPVHNTSLNNAASR